jgi:kynureninase
VTFTRAYDLEALRRAYSAFLGAEPGRVLLTGHSHQAWPDAAREAMGRLFDDSARFVDDKWSEVIFPKAETVGRAILARSGFDEADPLSFGRSTHELVYRLVSCFPRDARVVSTRGEFHSLDRQLRRLEEDGLRVTWVDAYPRATLAERVADALEPGVDLLALSAVFFEDGWVLREIGALAQRARSVGAEVLVDAYHAFHTVELDWGPARDAIFLTGGGYKYAGFGEGLCWLRSPTSCELRPAYTGWFADFGAIERPRSERIGYGARGDRFAGATFDAAPLYRAEAALACFEQHGLTVATLAATYRALVARVTERLEAAGLELLSAKDLERRAGFVSVQAREAQELVRRLRSRGVWVDARGSALRLGPAPYLNDDELERGLDVVIEELSRG